jgi:hypothetical protein
MHHGAGISGCKPVPASGFREHVSSGLYDLRECDGLYRELQRAVFALFGEHECVENGQRAMQASPYLLDQLPARLRIEVTQAREIGRGGEWAERVAQLVRELTYQRAGGLGPGVWGIQHKLADGSL